MAEQTKDAGRNGAKPAWVESVGLKAAQAELRLIRAEFANLVERAVAVGDRLRECEGQTIYIDEEGLPRSAEWWGAELVRSIWADDEGEAAEMFQAFDTLLGDLAAWAVREGRRDGCEILVTLPGEVAVTRGEREPVEPTTYEITRGERELVEPTTYEITRGEREPVEPTTYEITRDEE